MPPLNTTGMRAEARSRCAVPARRRISVCASGGKAPVATPRPRIATRPRAASDAPSSPINPSAVAAEATTRPASRPPHAPGQRDAHRRGQSEAEEQAAHATGQQPGCGLAEPGDERVRPVEPDEQEADQHGHDERRSQRRTLCCVIAGTARDRARTARHDGPHDHGDGDRGTGEHAESHPPARHVGDHPRQRRADHHAEGGAHQHHRDGPTEERLGDEVGDMRVCRRPQQTDRGGPGQPCPERDTERWRESRRQRRRGQARQAPRR